MAEVDEFLRLNEVMRASGKGRTALYAAVAKGEFPAPLKLSENGRAVGWLKSEVASWQRAQIARRDATLAQRARQRGAHASNEVS